MQTPTPPDAEPVSPRAESLIEYPCKFPIKVMGTKVDGLVMSADQLKSAVSIVEALQRPDC